MASGRGGRGQEGGSQDAWVEGGRGEGCCLRSCEKTKDREVRVELAGRTTGQDRRKYKVLVRAGREDGETIYRKMKTINRSGRETNN